MVKVRGRGDRTEVKVQFRGLKQATNLTGSVLGM